MDPVDNPEVLTARLPCPFCGGPSRVFGAAQDWAVECLWCDGASSGASRRLAIEKWNARRALAGVARSENPKPALGEVGVSTREGSPKQPTEREVDGAKPVEPEITRDHFGWIIVRDSDGGTLKSQSVEATLLYLILNHLRGERQ